MTKQKTHIVKKFNNLICDKTQKIKFWQKSKNLTVTKPKKLNYEKTKTIKLKKKLMNSNFD